MSSVKSQVAKLQARNHELEQQLRECQQELQQAKAAQQLAERLLATERQQFERSLQQNEAVWQQTFDQMQDVFFLKEIGTGKLLYINSAYEQLCQQSCEDLYQDPESWVQAVHPDDRDRILAKFKRELRGEEFFNDEYRIVWPDGSIRWIWDQSFPIRNEAGEIYRFAGISRDISDRKQAEQDLQQRIERQLALTRLVQLIRNSLDLNTIFATTVREVGEVMQIDQADIVRYLPRRGIWLSLADYRRTPGIPSGLGLEISDAGNLIAAQLKQGKLVEIKNYQQNDDEANRPLRSIYTYAGNWLHVPLWVEEQVWGCFSLNRSVGQKWQPSEIELARAVADQLAIAIQQANLYQQAQHELVERQRAETALHQLNHELEQRVHQRTTQLQMAVTAAGMGLWEWNLLDDTQVWSPENYVLSGFLSDERGRVLDLDGTVVSPCPTYELFLSRLHPEDRERVLQAQDRALAERSFYEAEYRLLFSDGTVGWRYTRGSYLFDAQGHPFKLTGIVMDVTQRKQVEQALQRQLEREKLLRTVTQQIHQAIDLHDVLTIAVTETRRIMQCDRVAIYQFHEDWSGSFVTESVGDGWIKLVDEGIHTVWQDTYLQETQGGRYRNHECLAIPDIYSAGHQTCHLEILEQFQVKAYIIVPIFVGEVLWGLLSAYQNSGARQWQSWEIELLEQITDPLAITIQQADLYSQLQAELTERKQAESLVKRQANADHLMAEIAQVINQSIHLEDVLQSSLEQVRYFFNADRVFVYQFHPDWTGTIELEAISRPEFSLLGQTIADECFVQIVAQWYQQGYVTIIPDVQNSGLSLCHKEFLTQLQVAANLVAPILKSDRLWGLLIIHQCHHPRCWQTSEVDFLRQVATQIGTASQKTDLYQQLEGELIQKDVLLKEIHHRVKNNLQIISSLLRMQSRQAGGDEEIFALFQDAQNRVQSMALIHEHLYQAEDLSQIDFGEYLHTLVNHLLQSYGVNGRITVAIATHDLTLTLNTAIPCGLIINELVSNSLKYAFPNDRPGHISLSLQREQLDQADVGRQITLVVEDNGIGIPETLDWQTTPSLGLRIVRNLVDQIKGKITLKRDSGSLFQISFPQNGDRH